MPVSLGFLEKTDPWRLESRFFPSKVGGKPAWLSLGEYLPTQEQLTCQKCSKVMVFLCQVYAPFESETSSNTANLEDNFHRTIFLFVCRNPSCHTAGDSTNIKVFRNNLPRVNNFYSASPPVETPENPESVPTCKLCNLCGISAHQQCSQCKKVAYCCRQHQVLDWKSGHKSQCTENSSENVKAPTKPQFLFDEWELVNEMEVVENVEVDEQKELEEFSKLKAEGKIGTLNDLPVDDLEAHASSENDKVFAKFKKKISHYPEQVIRYDRGGKPLYIAEKPLPTNIPDCESCGAPREFELQIMPQLLYQLKEHDIDWGVLLVYTCRDSCKGESINSYKGEFVFRQDVTNDV